MALAAEGHHRAVVSDASPTNTHFRGKTLRIVGAIAALVLMATAANCFLKYLWWAACYSAWSGIPKLAAQWQAAGTRASFYGWSLIVLELLSLLLIYSLFRTRQRSVFQSAVRLLASLAVTLVATGLFALVLSWLKQSH